MTGETWKDAATAGAFLDTRRKAVPYAADQIEVMVQLVQHFVGEPQRVLDLGCGDGLLARTLMVAWPECEAVLIDHSPPMLDRAREAMAPFEGRYSLVDADLAHPLPAAESGPFDVVVSGFAIHHLVHERKRSLYSEVFESLRPGGLFVNIEHVAAATAEGEALFDALYIGSLARATERPVKEVAYEYHSRRDKSDNILLDVETQLQWLREIGFGQVDCYFKWMELAVFAGVAQGVER